MKPIVQRGGSLSFSEKISRLATRLREPKWQRYGATMLAGKLAGVGLTLLVMAVVGGLFFAKVYAADSTVKAADIVNPVNTAWTLIAAFLVFGMQVGFTMLEAGFCRSRETVNVLMECIVDTCLCGILFYAIGFAFMFSHGNGFIGYHWFFLQDAPETYESTGVAFLAVWIFQFAFADTCSTITSGAMIGRTGFVGDLLYSLGVSGFIYPIIGHWAWGPDGFLATMGSTGFFLPTLGQSFHDFAGSTVVHTIGGFIALAGSIVLGPRLGRKFKRDGGAPMLPHDLTIAASGGLILWFGWYGFNPGSTLSAMDFAGIGRVSANTTLAACAAGLTAMIVCLLPQQEVGCRVHGERLSRWTCGHHLPLLLGQPDRRDPTRRRGRRSCLHGRRTPRVAAHRRPDRCSSGAWTLRHLGHLVAWPVCLWQVWCQRTDRS